MGSHAYVEAVFRLLDFAPCYQALARTSPRLSSCGKGSVGHSAKLTLDDDDKVALAALAFIR